MTTIEQPTSRIEFISARGRLAVEHPTTDVDGADAPVPIAALAARANPLKVSYLTSVPVPHRLQYRGELRDTHSPTTENQSPDTATDRGSHASRYI